MRVQVVPPDGATTCPIFFGPYSRLAQVHPGLRRILLQLGVVGDRPAERRLRPELRRDLHVVAIVLPVRRCVLLEQIGDPLHQAAVRMIDHVGEQLAGRGFGPDPGDQLTARGAHHFDPHEREALVEGLDELLFWLGEIGRVVDDLAFLAGRFDQVVAAESLRLGIRDAERCRGRRGRTGGELPASDQVGHECFSLCSST